MIRRSKEADTEKLLDIWLKANIQSHNFISSDYWNKMQPTVRKYYIPNTETFVYEDKRQIKGFISIIDDKYVGALFVSPNYQNKKIGTKLINYVKKIHPELSLKVFVKNEGALRFYQRIGFKIIDEQVDDRTKEKELLMSWLMESKTGQTRRQPGDS